MNDPGDADLANWHASLAGLQEGWGIAQRSAVRADQAAVEAWLPALAAMQSDQDQLIADRLWRSGPRTLLGALGVAHLELTMTAGLAWLLTPDGHHGLGPAVPEAFLTLAEVMVAPGDWGLVSVAVEETRGQDEHSITRADLVVSGEGWTVVVEAKTGSEEGQTQLDRIHRFWKPTRELSSCS